MEPLPHVYRNRRLALGLSQEKAAAAAGISRKTLSDFENGGLGISLGNLDRILRSVGLELTTREASARPTLDELADRYVEEEAAPAPRRVRAKKT